ncbi:hypothetical protein ABZW49_20295 [Nonomuraea wenchangensis]
MDSPLITSALVVLLLAATLTVGTWPPLRPAAAPEPCSLSTHAATWPWE